MNYLLQIKRKTKINTIIVLSIVILACILIFLYNMKNFDVLLFNKKHTNNYSELFDFVDKNKTNGKMFNFDYDALQITRYYYYEKDSKSSRENVKNTVYLYVGSESGKIGLVMLENNGKSYASMVAQIENKKLTLKVLNKNTEKFRVMQPTINDVKKDLLDSFPDELTKEDLDAAMVDFILIQTNTEVTYTRIWLGATFVAFTLSLIGLVYNIVTINRYKTKKLKKMLSNYGDDMDRTIDEINMNIDSNLIYRYKNFIISNNWMIYSAMNTYHAIKLSDIVWIYDTHINSRNKKSSFLNFKTKDKKSLTVPLPFNKALEAMSKLNDNLDKNLIMLGYSKETLVKYNQDPTSIFTGNE